jgi:ribonuclease HI
MKTGAGAGLLFISPLRKHVCYVIRLHFSASNNVAEYETLVNGLRIAVELGVRRLDARGDSQLVIDQVMKNSHCRDKKMEAYCDEVLRLEDKFHELELNHVARRYNETADELAKIASGRTTVPPNVFSRDIYQPFVNFDEAPEPDETSAQPEVPSAAEGEALRVEGERNGVAPNQDWQTPYLQYLLRGELPLDKAEARRLARRATSFVLLGDEKELYHRSPSGILQRCISDAQGQELLQEIHSGACGHHATPRTLMGNAFRQWHAVHWEEVPGLLRKPPHPCGLGHRSSPNDKWAGGARQRYDFAGTKAEDLQRPQQVRQAVDKRATLNGLESEDDVEPGHGFLAVLSSLWGRGHLTHGLRIQFPEEKGLRRPKQPDQPRRFIGPAGRGSGHSLTTLSAISAVSTTLPRPKGSAPRLPGGRSGTSAATRRPRAPQAYSPLGRALHHRQDFEARTYKLANNQGEVYNNAWNIQQLRRFYP